MQRAVGAAEQVLWGSEVSVRHLPWVLTESVHLQSCVDRSGAFCFPLFRGQMLLQPFLSGN